MFSVVLSGHFSTFPFFCSSIVVKSHSSQKGVGQWIKKLQTARSVGSTNVATTPNRSDWFRESYDCDRFQNEADRSVASAVLPFFSRSRLYICEGRRRLADPCSRDGKTLAIHTVEQVAKYDALIVGIRQQNKDLFYTSWSIPSWQLITTPMNGKQLKCGYVIILVRR